MNLKAYLIGEAGPVATACGVVLDFIAIGVWFLLFFAMIDTFSQYVWDWLVTPLLVWVMWWTWLRITRAWHHSQQQKQRKAQEQAEIERVFLERNQKN